MAYNHAERFMEMVRSFDMILGVYERNVPLHAREQDFPQPPYLSNVPYLMHTVWRRIIWCGNLQETINRVVTEYVLIFVIVVVQKQYVRQIMFTIHLVFELNHHLKQN